MEEENKQLIKLVEALDALSYSVLEVGPERFGTAEIGFSDTRIIQLRIIRVAKN